MTPAIQELLRRIEQEKNVEILYACESGSRAWGFASPDSDYDIRFLFAKPQADYISIHEGLESIDLPLEQGLLDAGGWDVRKAAKLLGKSNGALLEWLHSPIVYREKPGFCQRWQAAARRVFQPRACIDHYRGLAKQMILQKLQAEAVRAKDYLYALRAALAAEWILAGHGIPPVAFSELFPVAPASLLEKIPDLLAHKARSGEGELMSRVPEIDAFLHDFLTRSAERPATNTAQENTFILNQLLRAEIYRPLQWSAQDFTLERIREKDMLLFESIAGSHAYGTARPGSDEDKRGVFVAPNDFLLGGGEMPMVSDEKSDQVFYELGRFVDLLLKNNPNALEILAMPEDCILRAHPLFSLLDPAHYLSKICARTYGEYAMGQIRKARGLKKKIVNPQPEEPRTLLDFCHIPHGQGSVPLLEWLAVHGYDPARCGLTSVAHAPGIYAIYADDAHTYRGLISPKNPNAFLFSSVPHGAVPITWMHCNHDSFSAHCKAHQEYWEWVAQRNEDRYHTNMEHGRGYDSKNLMHTMRLLEMAEDIATLGRLVVRRPNREALMAIRAGEFSYEELLVRAEEQLARAEAAFARSALPEAPDRDAAIKSVLEIRHQFPH